jgi:dTDP-4-amino-4,6-dideoxygalactose transaminase
VSGQVSVPFLDLTAQTAEVRDEVWEGWTDVVGRSHFIGGERVTGFEDDWATYCGTSHAIGVANGTDALHLVLRALDIGPGQDVVIPGNTFVATAEAVVLAGAIPRFADVDPDTLLLTAETLKAAVTPTTTAVIVVHLFGQMADMDEIQILADELGIHVIEDAAQAQGARWRGRPAGSFGRAGCFSFYPGKNLGAFGDAGAVVTSDDALALRLRSLRDHGRRLGTHYDHVAVGTNSRLDALQAVVLSAKLKRLDTWNAARRTVMSRYRQMLDPDRISLVSVNEDSQPIYHLAVAQVNDRDAVREKLAAQGIATGIHYPTPCHLSEPYVGQAVTALPVVEAAAQRILSLPMYPHLAEEDVDRVSETLNQVVPVGKTLT